MDIRLDTYDWANAFGEDSITLRYEAVLNERNGSVSIKPFIREDVKNIFYMSEGARDERAWLIAGELHDGRFFYIEASCDYTGWDCQASGSCVFASSARLLYKLGITDEARRRFGL